MRKSIILITVAFGLGVLGASAQDAGGERGPERRPGGPGGRGQRPASPLLAAIDKNKDGKIDAVEITEAAGSLKNLDKNGDGQVSADEIQPPRPEGPPGGDRPARVSPIMAALDASGDGTLGAGELANTAAALKKLDKDGDGELVAVEFRGARPGGRAGAAAMKDILPAPLRRSDGLSIVHWIERPSALPAVGRLLLTDRLKPGLHAGKTPRDAEHVRAAAVHCEHHLIWKEVVGRGIPVEPQSA